MTDKKLYRARGNRSRDTGIIQLDKLDLKEIRRNIGRLFRIKPSELKFRNFFVLSLPILQRPSANTLFGKRLLKTQKRTKTGTGSDRKACEFVRNKGHP